MKKRIIVLADKRKERSAQTVQALLPWLGRLARVVLVDLERQADLKRVRADLVITFGGDGAIPLMKAYTAGDHRLSSAYGFDFLYAPRLTADLVADVMADWTGAPDAQGLSEGWPSWAFEAFC